MPVHLGSPTALLLLLRVTAWNWPFLLTIATGPGPGRVSAASDNIIASPFAGASTISGRGVGEQISQIPQEETAGDERLHVFTLSYSYVQIPYEITLWILLASLAKIGFHLYKKLPSLVPESCLLILIGLIIGGIMFGANEASPPVLSSEVFFLYLLPPIVLDAGYFMPTRPFFENIGTILWYAVIGTLWNALGIAMSLYGICQIEVFDLSDISMLQCLLFGSLISAVDPVAVLAVFEEIHINEQLYILVFGESLLNDAVTVALYNLFKSLCQMRTIKTIDVVAGFAQFIVVGIGGVLLGIIFGFAAAFTTRFTKNIRSIEPLFVFMYSYLSYLTAEMFHLSGIMAIVVCAMSMKHYVEENISQKSQTTTKYFLKMWSGVSETLIFIFLGVSTIGDNHEWNWAFVCFTLLFCLIWRGLGVFVLTEIINQFRTITLTRKDQFIIAYGGLRGAICFSLVFLLPVEVFKRKKLFITAAIVVILFSVFIQGLTIRPLVEFLEVKRSDKKQPAVSEEIYIRFMDHLVAGVEDVCGQWSHYYWKDKFQTIDSKYLRKILIGNKKPESSIIALYKKLELQHAIELAGTGQLSAVPSSASLLSKKEKAKMHFTEDELVKIQEMLSRNMYQIRQRTLSYSRHSLPRESGERQVKEILLRRHSSLRESMRKESYLQQQTQPDTTKPRNLSLPHNVKLPLRSDKRTAFTVGESSDSGSERLPARHHIKPKYGPPLKKPQQYRMEWTNEASRDNSRRQLSHPRDLTESAMNASREASRTRQAIMPNSRTDHLNEQDWEMREALEDRQEDPTAPPVTSRTPVARGQRNIYGPSQPLLRRPNNSNSGSFF